MGSLEVILCFPANIIPYWYAVKSFQHACNMAKSRSFERYEFRISHFSSHLNTVYILRGFLNFQCMYIYRVVKWVGIWNSNMCTLVWCIFIELFHFNYYSKIIYHAIFSFLAKCEHWCLKQNIALHISSAQTLVMMIHFKVLKYTKS